MSSKFVSIFLLALCLVGILAEEAASEEEYSKEERVLSVFNVVSFPNDVCSSDSNLNGTCYTTGECSKKGGTSSGSCGSGFGTCCVFTLACGESSSENNTYLVQASATSITSPCYYQICKSADNICRIRFDFTAHILADPSLGTVTAAGGPITVGGSIGDCATDTFSITSAGGATPVICGTNTGYHMIVDATSACSMVNFGIGSATSTTRSWDIYVTQFACGDKNSRAGPPGCLQYHTGTTGIVQSFGFPSATTITASVTHLSSQMYSICIRRESGYCSICYFPANSGTAGVIDQGTFGVSVASIAITANGLVSTRCITDYIQIPSAAATPGTLSIAAIEKLCGRFFTTTDTGIAHQSVCTTLQPFRVGVHFDENELTTTAIMAQLDETGLHPGGIIGFKLYYAQSVC